VLVVMMIAGIVAVGATSDRALDDLTKAEVEAPAQAHAVAEAGIVDAYAWFRRQTVQPVNVFAPQRDLSKSPPVNETDDPDKGLVREFEIGPNLWARYEVRKAAPAEPFTDANQNGLYDEGEPYVDQNGDGTWNAARETRDISEERGQAGTGAVWMLVSHGTVFARLRTDLPLGEGVNRRLAVARVATEIRRLALTPPAEAAVCSRTASITTLGSRSRVVGASGGGVVYGEVTGSPVFLSGSEVSGSPSSSAVPDYDGSIPGVFGVSLAELKSMADLSTKDASTVPAPLGDYTLTVIDGDAVFDTVRPLRGTGIVVVLGDCTLADGSNSFFNGLLWVGGNLRIRAPAYLRGMVVAEGSVDIRGTGGDYAELNYDDAIIGELLAVMGQYRHTKAIYTHDPDAMTDGRRNKN